MKTGVSWNLPRSHKAAADWWRRRAWPDACPHRSSVQVGGVNILASGPAATRSNIKVAIRVLPGEGFVVPNGRTPAKPPLTHLPVPPVSRQGELSRSDAVRAAGAGKSGLAQRDQPVVPRGAFPAPEAARRRAAAEGGRPALTGSAD